MAKHIYLLDFIDHLALAAFLAISILFFFDRRAARAFPPFRPPSRPRATAAGFFVGLISPTASPTMVAASRLGSVGFLERLGIEQDYLLLSSEATEKRGLTINGYCLRVGIRLGAWVQNEVRYHAGRICDNPS